MILLMVTVKEHVDTIGAVTQLVKPIFKDLKSDIKHNTIRQLEWQ